MYKETTSNNIKRIDPVTGREWIIPADEKNYQYQAYLHHRANGGSVAPATNVGVPIGKPAFRAYIHGVTNFHLTSNQIFPFNAVEYNIGNCFDTNQHRFTAPIDGVYHFDFYSIAYGPMGGGSIGQWKNGTGNWHSGYVHYSIHAAHWAWVCWSGDLYLYKDDYVSFHTYSNGQYHGAGWSGFSGHLIG